MSTILLVEDDEASSLSLTKHLRTRGHVVFDVRSSMAALGILDDNDAIDLVLTDIVLQKGEPNGLSLARMAQMKRRDIKTIMMTGYRDIAGDEAMMPGPTFYKPIDLNRLDAALAEIEAREGHDTAETTA